MQKKAIQRQEKKVNNKDEVKTWIAQELEVLMATIEANYSLEKLMQDRATLSHQLEQLKTNSNPEEAELITINEIIELRNAQITDLQQKILESDQGKDYLIEYYVISFDTEAEMQAFHLYILFSETRANTRWKMIRTTVDAKIAIETMFLIVEQDRKQQCYKYNELKVSRLLYIYIYNTHL